MVPDRWQFSDSTHEHQLVHHGEVIFSVAAEYVSHTGCSPQRLYGIACGILSWPQFTSKEKA